MHHILDLKLIPFPLIEGKDSCLTVYESGKEVPLKIERLFVIKAMDHISRGSHAHKECSQILIALNGECKVVCDDGRQKKSFTLNEPNQGLHIPPTIWAEQEYEKDTILMVLTDQPYDESDYIRNYKDFLKFRNKVAV